MRLLELSLSSREINIAGKTLAAWRPDGDQNLFEEAFNKLVAFRASHAYPLRIVTTLLGQRAHFIDPNATVYARTKRLASIISKLNRIPSMQVTTMQDLGGCRAVVDSIDSVWTLAEQFRALTPHLEEPREYDYISNPKADGYRSIHFVVRYKPRHTKYSHLPSRRIEIQVRSQLQHKWATALETIDLFTAQTLKAGGGQHFWKRFFVLTSSIFAMKENCPMVPLAAANEKDLLLETGGLWRGLRIRDQFDSWITAAQTFIPQKHEMSSTYLIETDIERKTTNVRTFPTIFSAYAEYNKAERRNQILQGRSAVLVSAISINQLRDAFPSYYGDTKSFLDEVESIL
jgi:hypothetical protein